MAKYVSNRQRNLKIGINSYTESQTVLEVTGKVGIATTNATTNLDVNGGLRIRGPLYDKNNEAGTSGQVLLSTASGVDWQDFGFSVEDESVSVGSTLKTLNFVGTAVTVSVTGNTATVTLSEVGAQGIPGPQGAQGVQGAQGAQGLQ